MITVTLNNLGGKLDTRQARTAEEAAQMAAEMILACGELYDGDEIQVCGFEEEK